MRRHSFFIITAILFFIGLTLSFTLMQIDRIRPIDKNNSSLANAARIPQRLICTAPSIVETVFALGEQKRIVGVSDFTTYPPEATQIDRIGGLIDPDFERMLALRPDLIVVQGGMQNYEEFCNDKKIPLLRVDMDSMDSIYGGILVIGEALGVKDKAESLIASIKEDLENVRQQSSLFSRKPSVFVCLGRREGSLTGLFTIHPISFINDLLQIGGAENIFNDIKGRYPQVSKESLLMRNPDVILELHPGEKLNAREIDAMIEDWNVMPTLSAVAGDRIHIVTDSCTLIPGPRIAQTARLFFEIFREAHD